MIKKILLIAGSFIFFITSVLSFVVRNNDNDILLFCRYRIPSFLIDIIYPIATILFYIFSVSILSNGKGILNWLSDKPIRYFILIFFILFSLIFYYSYFNGLYGDFDQILIESHGILFDLLILGILFTLYEGRKNKREEVFRRQHEKQLLIAQYNDEIDYSRDLDSDSIKHKLKDITKKLIDLEYSPINLSRCFLEGSNFQDFELKGVNFTESILNKANFAGSILIGAKFNKAKVNNAVFSKCSLSNSVFIDAELKESRFIDAIANFSHFDNALLIESILISTSFTGACFKRANLCKANLRQADLSQTDLRKTILDECNLIDTIFDDAWISDIDWIEHLKVSKIIGWEEIKKKYYVDSVPLRDEHGNIYYKIKKTK